MTVTAQQCIYRLLYVQAQCLLVSYILDRENPTTVLQLEQLICNFVSKINTLVKSLRKTA